MKKLILLFTCFISILSSNAQTIQAARTQGAGATVTITGTVMNGSEVGTIRFIQDNTGALSVYSSTLSNTDRGDNVTVTGTLVDYSGLLEMNPVSKLTVNSTGNTLPTPLVLTPGQIGESYESQLVQFNNVTFTTPGTPFAANTDFTFTDGSTTGIVYLKTGSKLIGTIVPTGSVNLIGFVSEYSSKYEIVPRDTDDIIMNSSLFYTSSDALKNLSTSGFDINWTTNKASNAFIKYGHTKNLELGVLAGTTNSTAQKVTLTGASPSEIFYVQTFSVNGTDTAASTIKTYITESTSSGKMQVYFTKSVDNTFSSGTNAVMLDNLVDDTLIAYIGRAKESLDIAIYNLQAISSLSDIALALNNAYSKGVKIRVVYDASTTNSGISDLNSAIPKLISNNPTGIMHNKFMVVDARSLDGDQPLVWTGSCNWTDDNINTDANNIIIIQDQSLALNYKLEFEEMWGDTGMTPNASKAKFGYNKEDNTAHNFIIGGKQVEQYFSPSDNANGAILDAIENTNDQLFIATMVITKTDIGYAIDDAVQAGVETYCMVNSEGECNATVVSILKSDIGDHLVFYSETGILHHKYMISDPNNTSSDPLVLTGSHNWSSAANSDNDENTLVVHDATIANIYLQEYMSRYNTNWVAGSGIEEVGNIFENITAYPNPADNYVHLAFNLTNAKDVNVKIVDLLGKVIATENYAGKTGVNMITLNTDLVSKGLYQLVLSAGNATKSLKVMVK